MNHGVFLLLEKMFAGTSARVGIARFPQRVGDCVQDAGELRAGGAADEHHVFIGRASERWRLGGHEEEGEAGHSRDVGGGKRILGAHQFHPVQVHSIVLPSHCRGRLWG